MLKCNFTLIMIHYDIPRVFVSFLSKAEFYQVIVVFSFFYQFSLEMCIRDSYYGFPYDRESKKSAYYHVG